MKLVSLITLNKQLTAGRVYEGQLVYLYHARRPELTMIVYDDQKYWSPYEPKNFKPVQPEIEESELKTDITTEKIKNAIKKLKNENKIKELVCKNIARIFEKIEFNHSGNLHTKLYSADLCGINIREDPLIQEGILVALDRKSSVLAVFDLNKEQQ